jgi:hypothetical protein
MVGRYCGGRSAASLSSFERTTDSCIRYRRGAAVPSASGDGKLSLRRVYQRIEVSGIIYQNCRRRVPPPGRGSQGFCITDQVRNESSG